MPRFSLFPIWTLGVFLAGPTLAAEPSPYVTVLKDGTFEVRDYPARRVAEMTVVGDKDIAAYHGVRIFVDPTLRKGKARYSTQWQTPVVETPAPSELVGTDPLFQISYAGAWTVSFEPPVGWSPGKLANGKSSQIRVHDAPPARLIAMIYDGNADWRRAAGRFMTQVARHGLKTQGPIMLANYSDHTELMIAAKDSAPTPTQAPSIPPR